MLTVAPDRILNLNHRASFLRRAESPSVLVIASKSGEVSIIEHAEHRIARLRLSTRKIDAISVHPTEALFAVTGGEGGALNILRFDGSTVASLNLPPLDHAVAAVAQTAYKGCIFTDDGKSLWCAAPLPNGKIDIQLRETEHWNVLATTEIEDPFGESFPWFDRGNGRGVTTLWLAAGQDGQQICWATATDCGYGCTTEPALRNTSVPDIAPNGRELLVVEDSGLLTRYDFPPKAALGHCECPGSPDEVFVDLVRYIDDWHAVAKTNNGRLFLIDAQSMLVRDEISIRGHEPQPVEVYYPTLHDDRTLCTDISHFERLGDVLAVVYRRDSRIGLEGWTDSVALLPLNTLLR